MPAHDWFILGLILLIGEVFTTDFSLSCIGIACFVSALCSWLGLNVYWQLAIGAITIYILFFTLRPFMLKYMYRKGEKFKGHDVSRQAIANLVVKCINGFGIGESLGINRPQ